MWWVVTFTLLGVAGAFAWSWLREREKSRGLSRSLASAQDDCKSLTQQRQRVTAEAEAQRAALFDSIGEGVVWLDESGRVQQVNHALERLFDLKTDIRGLTLIEAFRLTELQPLATQALSGGNGLIEELDLPGSTRRQVQVTAASVASDDGKGRGAILVFHDLTRIKHLEQRQQEFVANVSHELRTPISMIKGYAETLLDGAKNDPVLATRFLGIIAKHTERLIFLVEDLLSLSQLEAGQVPLKRTQVVLKDLVNRVIEDLTARATLRQTTIQNQIPAHLVAHADSDRLQQVFSNLVDNAIKYGRNEGQVIVGARLGETGKIEAWVQDDGPGIPPESLARVFERFYRVDKARSREQGGTGLGLAIVRHIMQAHGGDVWARSAKGAGATFYLTLPCEPAMPPQEPPPTD